MLVSKLDAARRQLETAVDLYFSNKDPISIHTLTCAAYNIVRDISSRISDTKMIIKDQMFAYIKPEYEKEVRNKINEAENFFKHADRDHDKNIEFHSGFTDFMLHDACNQYHMITQEAPPLLKLFSYWLEVVPVCWTVWRLS